MANPIQAVVPHMVVKNAAEAIAFYVKAFGAKELFRMPAPDGTIMHAQIEILGGTIMLAEECPMSKLKSPETIGGSSTSIHLNVHDVDSAFAQAVAAGGEVVMPPQDMFWGDRYGVITDPFGHVWSLATHIEDVAPAEMQERMQAMFSGAK